MSVYVVLAAGGSGSRMGASVNKVLLPLSGQTVLCRSLRLFEGLIDGMALVCRPEDEADVREEVERACVTYSLSLVPGGATRQASVLNGLRALRASPQDQVLIHDAARCMTPRPLIQELIRFVRESGPCVPGLPVVNTVKVCDPDHRIVSTPDRSVLFEVQTPQAFPYGLLLSCYEKAEAEGVQATDDASLLEYYGLPVRIFPGSRRNFKITEKEDLLIAKAMLANDAAPFRVGMGYDVHRLVENRRLILCGIEIPHATGLLGHSDADVALHALMDAMLGAAALGDIGKHFPDTSADFEGISSLLLLKKVNQLLQDAGFALVNADVTIIAQRPKLAAYIPAMREKIAETLACDISQISVKATTTEKLGFEGREEGIAAQAVCTVRPQA